MATPNNDLNPDGSLNVERVGSPRLFLSDTYHFFLTTSWLKLRNRVLKQPLQYLKMVSLGLLFTLAGQMLWENPAAAETLSDAHRAYDNNDFRKAIRIFDAHYKKNSSAGLLFNLGKCHEKLGNLQAAIASYEAYLKQRPDAPDKTSVTQLLIRLRRKEVELRPTLSLKSSPRGARVYWDAKFIGETPVAIKVVAGTHALELRYKGHAPHKSELTIKPDLDLEKAYVLVPLAPPKVSALKLQGGIAGAAVYLDGKKIGMLPLVAPYSLKAGPHRIRVAKVGYQTWEHNGEFSAGSTKTLTVTSRPTVKPRPASRSIGTKAILGFSALGLAVASESLAILFTSQANQLTEETPDFNQRRDMAIGMHAGAAIATAAAISLITWWLLEGKSDGEKRSAATAHRGLGAGWAF